jgi:hypothetical protein
VNSGAYTRAVFGDYISVYDIQQAVNDGATVRIYYESRLAKLELNEAERPKIDPEFEEVNLSDLWWHHQGHRLSRILVSSARFSTFWARSHQQPIPTRHPRRRMFFDNRLKLIKIPEV